MMNATQYLLFIVDGQHYALPATDVDRIVQLPALSTVPNAPANVAGVFNIGGTMISVLDLSLVFQRPANRYLLTDCVIVFQTSGHRKSGIIANKVLDVCAIPNSEIETVDFGPRDQNSRFAVLRAAHVNNELVLLLNFQSLISPDDAGVTRGDSNSSSMRPEIGIPTEEWSVFRERSRNLVNRTVEQAQTEFPEYVVIGLNDEYFGLSIESVREFCDIRNLSPVPCCPPHITGTMNLRGEILTVVDLRPVLKMSVPVTRPKKIAVLIHEGMAIGAVVDEIYDVVRIDPAQITRLPLTADAAAREYLVGNAIGGTHVLSILDSAKLFANDDLVVNDEIQGGLCPGR